MARPCILRRRSSLDDDITPPLEGKATTPSKIAVGGERRRGRFDSPVPGAVDNVAEAGVQGSVGRGEVVEVSSEELVLSFPRDECEGVFAEGRGGGTRNDRISSGREGIDECGDWG
jgi:hypothetical protein